MYFYLTNYLFTTDLCLNQCFRFDDPIYDFTIVTNSNSSYYGR